MAGFGDLLSVLMQGGLSSQGNNRAGSAMNNLGQAGGVLGQILGGSSASAAGTSSGGGLLGSLLEAAGDMMSNSGNSPQRHKTLSTGGLGALAGASSAATPVPSRVHLAAAWPCWPVWPCKPSRT